MREMKVDQIHYVCTAAVGAADDRMFSLVSFCVLFIITQMYLLRWSLYLRLCTSLRRQAKKNEKGMTAKGV
jgi:hypothetical protein